MPGEHPQGPWQEEGGGGGGGGGGLSKFTKEKVEGEVGPF